jgi:hypothetical protein
MVQPTHDPDRVLNLRVTPELKARLAALLDLVPTGAAKLSRHGLAVWCLERGLMEAEAAPSSVLALPTRPARPATPSPAPAPAAPRVRPERATAPSPPVGEGPDPSDVRARLAAARDRGVTLAEIGRRAGMVPSGLSRFLAGQVATLKGDGLARVVAALGELKVP